MPNSRAKRTETNMSHLVLTGPVFGSVVLNDGTKIDVTPSVIEVATEEQAAEVSDLIGRMHVANGHPTVEGEFEYVKDPAALLATAANTDRSDSQEG